MNGSDIQTKVSPESNSNSFCNDIERLLYEQSDEPEYTYDYFDTYISKRLTKFCKIYGSKLA